MERDLTPLANALDINKEVAILGLRLRQGDYEVIEDKAEYLKDYFPSSQERSLMKGLCGVLRAPMGYPFKRYQQNQELPINFQGATEQLAKILKLNPLLFRLAALDSELLNSLAEDKDFVIAIPVLIAFIASLSNLPRQVVRHLYRNDIKRKLHHIKLTNS